MPSGKIVCHTCNKVLQTFDAPDAATLAIMAEVAILDNHVSPPHASSHHLRAHLDTMPDEPPQLLRVKCLHPGCRRSKNVQEECPPSLVNAAVMAMHASHEGHPLSVSYGDTEFSTGPHLEFPPICPAVASDCSGKSVTCQSEGVVHVSAK